MNLEHYHYVSSNEHFDYEFYSEGPQGRINKIVTFTKIQDSPVIYNLAFGDKDSKTGLLDDLAITNNDDRNKVLATVANTINDFCDHYGNHYIYAEGSTQARTRLYQISISALLDEISTSFDVFGLKDDILYRFQRNVNYDAFLVKRK